MIILVRSEEPSVVKLIKLVKTVSLIQIQQQPGSSNNYDLRPSSFNYIEVGALTGRTLVWVLFLISMSCRFCFGHYSFIGRLANVAE